MENKLDDFLVLKAELGRCKKQLNFMTMAIDILENRIDNLESRIKRSNLVVYGLPKTISETNGTLWRTVKNDVIQEKLKLQLIAIERIHELGKVALIKQDLSSSNMQICDRVKQ